jgi:hypothetical protein
VLDQEVARLQLPRLGSIAAALDALQALDYAMADRARAADAASAADAAEALLHRVEAHYAARSENQWGVDALVSGLQEEFAALLQGGAAAFW